MLGYVNRRKFLKVCSGTVSAIAGASFLPGTLGALEQFAVIGSEEFVGSICDMCSSGCQIEGKVVGGKNVFIQGNRHSKRMGGSVCARGASGHSQLYDKQRLVSPLIRVGERGENKWQKISWEQALDEIADKLTQLTSAYGPECLAVKEGTYRSDLYPIRSRFLNLFGNPGNFVGPGTVCLTNRMALYYALMGTCSVI